MRSAVIVTAVAFLFLGANEAAAQGVGSSLDVEVIARKQLDEDTTVWTAKFLCGTIESSASDPQLPASPTDPLTPGTYRTAINILGGISNIFGLKLVVKEAKPLDEPAGRSAQRNLPAEIEGKAFEVDCKQITDLLYPPRGGVSPPSFLKGFVQIRHDPILGPGSEPGRLRGMEVIAVYTSNRTKLP